MILCQIYVLQIFSPTLWLAPLLVSFSEQKFLILLKSNLSIFSFLANAFDVWFIKSFSIQM